MPYLLPTSCSEGVEHVPLRTVEHEFPGEVTSASAARKLVREHLDPDQPADDCALIVSELVTNAVLHGGSAVRLTLTTQARRVYAEVADGGEGRPRVSDGDLDATGGRGLLIVAMLAREWGVIAVPGGGKIVWFTLEG